MYKLVCEEFEKKALYLLTSCMYYPALMPMHRDQVFRSIARLRSVGLILACSVTQFGASLARADGPTRVPVALNSFPYAATLEADTKTKTRCAAYSTLWTVQIDNGVPWGESLEGGPLPAKVLEDWKGRRVPAGKKLPVHLAVAPLAMERDRWADGFEGAAVPDWTKGDGDVEKLLKAYDWYVEEAIQYFKPAFLNIGVEAGDLCDKNPKRWKNLAAVLDGVRKNIKKRHPDLPVGVSFSVPVLMKDGVLERAKPFIEALDYCGLSFYPHLLDFYRLTADAKLPDPPERWREPLAWVRSRISVPLAMAETGYGSAVTEAKKWKLKNLGSPPEQAAYVRDLAAIARRDRYLFVNFFLLTDYDELMRGLPEAHDLLTLWQRTGFFTHTGEPKPAWQVYKDVWLGGAVVEEPEPTPAPSSEKSAPLPAGDQKSWRQGAEWEWVAPPGARVAAANGPNGESGGLRWSFTYGGGDFSWMTCTFARKLPANTTELHLALRSDSKSPILLQFKQDDGKSFTAIIVPNTEWKTHRISIADLKRDDGKSGVLAPDKITSALLADGANKDHGTTGDRWIEISPLVPHIP